jgi:hypothetical protein
MAEYIERDEAVRTALAACIKVVGHGISQIDAVDIAEAMDSIPAADVVEVVRCKDCKHYCLSDYRKPNEPRWCEKFEDGNYFPKPTDFCSLGAKMDGKDRQYDKY